MGVAPKPGNAQPWYLRPLHLPSSGGWSSLSPSLSLSLSPDISLSLLLSFSLPQHLSLTFSLTSLSLSPYQGMRRQGRTRRARAQQRDGETYVSRSLSLLPFPPSLASGQSLSLPHSHHYSSIAKINLLRRPSPLPPALTGGQSLSLSPSYRRSPVAKIDLRCHPSPLPPPLASGQNTNKRDGATGIVPPPSHCCSVAKTQKKKETVPIVPPRHRHSPVGKRRRLCCPSPLPPPLTGGPTNTQKKHTNLF